MGTENLQQSSIYPKSIYAENWLFNILPHTNSNKHKLLEFDVASLEWNSFNLTKEFIIIESTPFAQQDLDLFLKQDPVMTMNCFL